MLEQENKFSYTYSAMENQEVLDIRKKYLPQQEDKLEELKRLDQMVQNSGTMAGLCVGVTGTMILGLGMCLAMKVIGQLPEMGVIVGLIGFACILNAFPACHRTREKAKAKYAPSILQLADELAGGN